MVRGDKMISVAMCKFMFFNGSLHSNCRNSKPLLKLNEPICHLFIQLVYKYVRIYPLHEYSIVSFMYTVA